MACSHKPQLLCCPPPHTANSGPRHAVDGVPTFHLVAEALLVAVVIKLIFFPRRRSTKPDKLSEQEEDELIAEWQPEPLLEKLPTTPREPPVVEGTAATHMKINGSDKINMATYNFLGFSGDKRLEDVAVVTAEKYGVGSCGPRGFYGTIDVHLDLEEALAKFYGVEEAIIYAYGFSTVASAIPAYSKRGDIIFCDKGVNFAIQKGLVASRSDVRLFEHNDMADLERLLEKQAATDRKNPKKAMATRRFLVVEGIFLNSGDMCPLPRLIELKYKYKLRLIIDESVSFGVVGKSGRGVTEHFNVNVDDVDLIAVSMGAAIGSIGGFCVGRSFVIDHQRLNGAGYCYSASLPPMLATAANKALDIIDAEGADLVTRVQRNTAALRSKLAACPLWHLSGDPVSPIFHIRIHDTISLGSRDAEEAALRQIADKAMDAGVAVSVPKYLAHEELALPDPSIRMAVSAAHTASDIDTTAKVLVGLANEVLGNLPRQTVRRDRV